MSFIRREKKWKPQIRAGLLAAFILLGSPLTGCMYPGKAQQTGSSYRESVQRVQAAVEDYRQQEGLLPILNADEAVPRYEKFVIDLKKLQETGYLEVIPAAAFEKGGSAYFLILDEESRPTVKLMDLVTVQKVNDVQRQINRFKSGHGGRLPVGEEIYPDLFTIDARQAGTASITLNSIYSGQPLSFIMDRNGAVYADYSLDIMSAVQKNGGSSEAGTDLRLQLEQASYYVPVKSLPYYWVDGQPVPQSPL
ncbi:hypothetical protein [Paenibacillus sp. S150]|uniref:hypothetical protein n=1 Tax=Paenibacillus sp. S150 TaxID=2749826 RepID=UPI002814E373|nr:hypothetical protein [Paenibacillus sp. S150]